MQLLPSALSPWLLTFLGSKGLLPPEKKPQRAPKKPVFYQSGTVRNPKVASHVNMMYEKWRNQPVTIRRLGTN